MNALWLGLGQFLASIFGKSMSFFVHRFSGALVFKQAQIALIFLMMGTLYIAVTTILGSIYMALPSELSIPLSWVVPSNIDQLITAYVTFRIALALYRWKHTQISKLSYC